MNGPSHGLPRADRSALQSTAAAVVIVLAAGLIADLVLWPRDQLPPVAAVAQEQFFTASYIARAADFRGVQSWLAIGSALVFVGVPLVIALAWPTSAREGSLLARWSDRRSGVVFGRGGIGTTALVATGVAFFASVVALPLQAAMFGRARRAGLAVQSSTGWFLDWLLATALTLVAIALLAALAGWLIRRIGRAWWGAFGACLVLLAIIFQLLAPVLIEPLFANFTKLPPGPVRTEVQQIAERSGVHAGAVYEVDASARTTGANAYVSGLGSTKRVVVYDTLLREYPSAERRAVLAHEFGHAKHNDLLSGLVWFAFVALLALAAVDILARVLARRRGVDLGSPAGIAMVLAASLVALALSQPAANAYSRAIEARADGFALQVTHQPDAAIALEKRLTTQNLSRPEPPSLQQLIFGTHPTPMQRIGMAVTVRRELAAGRSGLRP